MQIVERFATIARDDYRIDYVVLLERFQSQRDVVGIVVDDQNRLVHWLPLVAPEDMAPGSLHIVTILSEIMVPA